MNAGREPAMASCPSEDKLVDLLHGRLSQSEDAALADHITSCAGCQKRIEVVSGTNDFRNSGTHLIPPDATPDVAALIEAIATQGPMSGQVDVSELLTPSQNPEYLGMFDGYEVIDVVGHGGMGMVLKARDPALDRIVAIKTLLPHLALSVRARERFLREAKNTAAVNHPNIVTIHSVDVRKGVPYIVMEFIQGRSLEAELAAGPISENELIRISHQIALALAAAHAQGLIHRDIKPANILLENGIPRVKVTDFGLSRAIDDTSITRSGTIAGTPQFMSPEQAEGKTADWQSDVFSLGAVMYTMCTGKPAFEGESALAVMRNVCDRTPTPIRKLNPAVPGWIERIVDGLLRKNPDRRPAAKDVADMLSAGMSEPQQHSRTSWIWGVGAAIMLLAALGIWRVNLDVANVQTDATVQTDESHVVAGLKNVTPSDQESLRFVVGSTGDSHQTLAEAIEGAASEDEIIVSGSAVLRTPEINVVGKNLTIAAAKGSRPILESYDGNEHLIYTDGSLVLRGLTLRPATDSLRAAVQFRDSMIRCWGEKLVLERCAVTAGLGFTGVGANCATVEIVDSFLRCESASGVMVRTSKATEITLRNSLVASRIGVTFFLSDDSEVATLNVERSHLVGSTAVRLAVENSMAPEFLRELTEDTPLVEVNTSHSIFDVSYGILNSAQRNIRLRQPLMVLERLVSWSDEQSFYYLSSVPAVVGRRRGVSGVTASESSWDEWTALFGIDAADCVLGSIQYKGSARQVPADFQVIELNPAVPEPIGPDISTVGPR